MAITHTYTLLCDEVRQENNGKFIILGLYTPDVTVAQLPFALPSLTFFTMFETDQAGTVDFNFRLNHRDELLAGGSGQLGVLRAGTGVIPLRLGPLVIQAAGPYILTIDLVGSAPITHEFSVVLQQNLGAPVGPPRRGPVH